MGMNKAFMMDTMPGNNRNEPTTAWMPIRYGFVATIKYWSTGLVANSLLSHGKTFRRRWSFGSVIPSHIRHPFDVTEKCLVKTETETKTEKVETKTETKYVITRTVRRYRSVL